MNWETEKARAVALFVFIPFCKIKCTYCDFNAYANLTRVLEPYSAAVAQEIRNSQFAARNSTLAPSIYFGGGTPSLLPVARIAEILRACHDTFAVAPAAEITLETNPGTATAEQLRALHTLGVNRLSLGAQTFDDAALRRLNRGHTTADTLATYEHARRAGFENISLDFIYGLPLQTLADWRATLARAVALAPEHLSLYALQVEAQTGLAHQIARGKYAPPDDDLAAEMYELAQDMLGAAGYAQYEISNWSVAARDQKLETRDWHNDQPPTSNLQPPTSSFQSRHNLVYWHNEPYLGFGAGAHSCLGGERFWNVASPVEYIARVTRGASAIAGRERIDRALEMAETLILGLRLNAGITFAAFAARYGEEVQTKHAQKFAELQELGLIETDATRVRLTPRGRLLSNEVFWRLLPN